MWAGHQDAPLSNHGMNQAKRVGAAFASTRIDALYSSDLKRAHWTALQIHRHHGQPTPSPTASPNKRKRAEEDKDAPRTAEAIAGPSSPAHVDAGSVEGDGPSSAPQPSTLRARPA